MKAVASRRSNVGSAIVAPQQRGASLPLRPQVGELMGYMVMDCTVDSQEYLATPSKMAAMRRRKVSVVDAEINTPNANVTCFQKSWLWVLLLTMLLSSSGAYSATDTQRSEEGTCRYDLTSVAVLSCMQPNGVWKPSSSSQTCCNALLYAIDQVPASDESGACCLCRYMKERWGPPELGTTYILCNGKDRHIISKWSTFHIEDCLAECTKTNISSVDISADSEVVHVHDTSNSKGIWIAVTLFSVMALICLWYFWRSTAANTSEQRRTSSYEGEPQVGRQRSIIASSSPSKKLKERRISSS
ncbi:uncharacterized protein [Miscanthus floridulus]|uniref:uncharacterized protein n=1 Tax=Miscanthus floridulus TaxID=154761 RepID=UPI003458F26D